MLRAGLRLWSHTVAKPPRILSCGSAALSRSHRWHGTVEPGDIRIIWKSADGETVETMAGEGTNLLDLAHANDIDVEGACEGSCACSTCHVYISDMAVFERLAPASEDEEDMLDLAFELKENSRLGCQVKVEGWMDGTVVELPVATVNMRVDGSKPTH